MTVEPITDNWVKDYLARVLSELKGRLALERKEMTFSRMLREVPTWLPRLRFWRVGGPRLSRAFEACPWAPALILKIFGPDKAQLVTDCFELIWELGQQRGSSVYVDEDVLEPFMHFEWLLHQEDLKEKRYRDHFFHEIKTAVLCHFILHEWHLQNGDKVVAHLADHLIKSPQAVRGLRGGKIDPGNFASQTLCVAALCHDHGYPFAFYQRVGQGLADMYGKAWDKKYFPGLLQPFGPDPEEAAVAMARTLVQGMEVSDAQADVVADTCRYFVTQGAFEGMHGVPGALLLVEDRLPKLWVKLNPAERLSLQFAAWAVLNHDNPLATLDFEEDPLLYLLHMADELQDWGRILCAWDVYRPDASGELRRLVEIDKLEMAYDLEALTQLNATFHVDVEGLELAKKVLPEGVFNPDRFRERKNTLVDELTAQRGRFPLLRWNLAGT